MTDQSTPTERHEAAPFTLTTKQAARRYSISTRTLATWRTAGMPCLIPSRKKVLFVTNDADAWVRAKFSVGRPKPTMQRLARAAAVPTTGGQA